MPLSLNRFRYGTGLAPDPGVGKPRPAARAAVEPPPLPTTARLWPTGPVLNQRSLGACGAFATTAELIAEPAGQRTIAADVGNKYGVNHFKRARVLVGDTPLPAPSDPVQGSYLFANLAACVERGLITSHRRLPSIEELASAVVNEGPVILGLQWLRSFEQTGKNGLMKYAPSTVDRGYHAILITGYDPARALEQPPKWVRGRKRPQPPLPPEPMFLLRNSWGTAWGAVPKRLWGRSIWDGPLKRTGNGWMRLRDLRHMWDAGTAYAYAPAGRGPVDLAAVLAAFPDPYQPPPPPRPWS